MFFTPAFNYKWFVLQQGSRYLMVLLLVFALFIPLLYMPQEADAEFLTVAAIVGGVAIIVTIWIYLDGNCDNCGSGREDAHTTICSNCLDAIFNCPLWGHPHLGQCGQCYRREWSCDAASGPTSAERWEHHTVQECDYCPDEYRPCTEGDEHGDGVCNNNEDLGSSGNNSSPGMG